MHRRRRRSAPLSRLRAAAPIAIALSLGALASCGPGNAPGDGPPPAGAPGPFRPSEEGLSHLNVGVRLLEQFRYADAAERFEAALALHPRWHEARLDLAIAQLNDVLADGHADRALEQARRAWQERPDDPRSGYVLGYVLAEQARQPREALAVLRRVAELAPDDAWTWYLIGRSAADLSAESGDGGLLAEAEAAHRRALELDPRLSEANYKLARLLVDSDDPSRREEGLRLLERHQELIKGRPPVQQNYLRRGPLALAPRHLRSPAPAADPAPVPFRPARSLARPPFRPVEPYPGLSPNRYRHGVSVADLDHDGRLDLLVASRETAQPGLLVWRGRDGGVLAPPRAAGLQGSACASAVPGDFDRDGDVDVFVTCNSGNSYLVNQGDGTLAEGNVAAGLSDWRHAGLVARAVDLDHDGDLDLHVVGPGRAEDGGPWQAACRVHRNDGSGRFEEVAAGTGLAEQVDSLHLAWSDMDGDNAVDLLASTPGRGLTLYTNSFDGRFTARSVASLAGLDALAGGPGLRLAIGDLDHDLDLDVVAVTAAAGGPSRLRVLENRSTPGAPAFSVVLDRPAPAGAAALALADLDLDGHAELVLFGAGPAADGPSERLETWTLEGGARVPVRAISWAPADHSHLAFADLDRDGDLDLLTLLRESRDPAVLWNDLAPGPGWLTLELEGRPERSNPHGLGAKLTVSAGSLVRHVERREAAGPFCHVLAGETFGIGDRPAIDGVTVLWPSGIRQAEIDLPAGRTHAVVEIDRQPSSCPMLYGWDGERYAFLTDCFDTAPLGLWVAPGTHVAGDPEEYYRLRPGAVAPVDGVLNLSVAEFLNESLLADRAALLAIDLPEGRTLLVDEGVRFGPATGFSAWSVGRLDPPLRVRQGERDVTARLAAVDRAVAGWQRADRFLGLAERHALEVELERSEGLLVLTGSLNFPNSTNLFAAWQAGRKVEPPTLELWTGQDWAPVLPDCGLPAGFHKDVLVDLRALGLSGPARLRMTTNLQVSWDRVAFSADPEPVPLEAAAEVPRLRAVKSWLGVPPEVRGPENRWRSFPREGLAGAADWVRQAGPVTADGRVGDLLAAVDGRLAILRPGEELELAFDAAAVPGPVPGRARTHVLALHGWVKDADPHTAHSASVLPLPVAGRALYP